ncbi:uncharacterized protein SPAPADRAFT_63818 [Spathaspora passalidarum NRRL Y-27907]|uniref:Uncharacterized protein n=1 Tax=Spathaspora passalidarum (strain NRRL Y-27907 / 11-Y1) TaxID=619300 RepID=G3AVP0_SPAPN|nr:uncharacterized protein SPAPADRAFT_63818 [Spathaspora passalidarum NRRL Y-27907]EGW30205.1 hypothetical protein SPAPADRAFT_63818 [Spathaspora passalidarum NRRL Y-27907]
MYPFNTYNLPNNFDVDSLFNLLHQQQYYQQAPNSRPRVVKKLETEDEFQIQIYKPYGNFNNYEVRVVKATPPIVKVIISSAQDKFRQEFQFNVNYIDIENINWQWYKSRNILCLNIPKRIHYVHSNLEDILNCLVGNHEHEYQGEPEQEPRYLDEESDFDEEDACPAHESGAVRNGFIPQQDVASRRAAIEKSILEQRQADAAARRAEEEAERSRREAEERARQEAERARREAEERARREEQARREADERARREAEEAARREEQARREAQRKAELEYRRHIQQEAKRKHEQHQAALRQQQAEKAKRNQDQLDYDDFAQQQRDFLNQFFGFNLGRSPPPQFQSSQPAKPAVSTKPPKTTTSKPKPQVAPKPENLRKQSIPVKVHDTDADSISSDHQQAKIEDSHLAALHKHPSLEEVEDEESIMFRKKFGH